MHLRTFAACSLLFLLLCGQVLAEERITSFDSWINIEQDGRVTVVETIEVIAGGDQIKRGIYRDFPTDYRTPSGKLLKVDFTVLSVQRDGNREPYHLKRLSNGTRVYIGDKEVFLDPGPYTYTLTYQTDRQLGFFPDFDELYWNVTGNDWAFPIDQASATVVLPSGAPVLRYSYYTGRQGSTSTDAEMNSQTGREISFRTTRPLAVREGLTIAVAWPKGFVHEPDMQDRAAYFLRDHLAMAVAAAGLLVLLFYYVTIWAKVGRDPEPEAIIPRFAPPADFTPAAARFVMKMGFDDKTFTSALVSMAVKKHIVIDNDGDDFTLEKNGNKAKAKLSRGEQKVLEKLFGGGDHIVLKQSNHKRIGDSLSALENSLQDDFEALHFKRNSIYMLPGLALTILMAGAIFLTADNKETAVFMAVWLSMWTVGCYALVHRIYTSWRTALTVRSGLGAFIGALFITVFAIPFIGAWFVGAFMLTGAASIGSVIALVGVIGLNLLFYVLLKAPTLLGRRIMDQLEGFKLYLTVAEKDRLNMLNPPEKTPELFERFLPWALALDVEQQWSEQFDEVLKRAMQDGTYDPSWYRGPGHFSPSGLASSLGSSLSGSIASSSTAPGSSSGSGGGGSSGGGGGGGGGGGW